MFDINVYLFVAITLIFARPLFAFGFNVIYIRGNKPNIFRWLSLSIFMLGLATLAFTGISSVFVKDTERSVTREAIVEVDGQYIETVGLKQTVKKICYTNNNGTLDRHEFYDRNLEIILDPTIDSPMIETETITRQNMFISYQDVVTRLVVPEENI